MSPHLAYHVTRGRDYLAIRRAGLLARDTAEHNYADMADCLQGNCGIPAVYCWTDRDDAEGWRAAEGWYLGDGLIIVPFDRAGLDVEADPVLGGPYWASASRIRGDVAPDRIFTALDQEAL